MALAATLGSRGARLEVVWPDASVTQIGTPPALATVSLRSEDALRALLRGDHLALGECHLDGAVDVRGDFRQVMHVLEHLDVVPARREALRFWLRAWLDRRRFHRESVAFHYETAPRFFLPWLGKHRCYTHGFYEGESDQLDAAHERKLAYVLEALALRPGMRVLDVGFGWGAFLEFAAERGITVHGLTLAEAQRAFVARRIAERGLRASVACEDFADHAPTRPYDAVVFMGSLEHIPSYRLVTSFLRRHLAPGGRVYADFVSSPEGRLAGRFLRRHVFPGSSGYVDVAAFGRALGRAGVGIETLRDETASYVCTVRDWALAFDASRDALAAEFGERAVRAFGLYLWSAHHFLQAGRTRGWHVVAARPAVAGAKSDPS
jgi:cyclopropane-fatty-acyl-phospholipid synthase